MNFESSRVTVTVTAAGSALRMPSSFALTPSITATVFSPIARLMSRLTAGASPSQTACVGRSVESSA